MKTIITALALVLAATGTASAEDFSPDQIHRQCTSRVDTNCVMWITGHPTAEGPTRVRYTDNGQFCVIKRPPIGSSRRCEDHWPFTRPVINP